MFLNREANESFVGVFGVKVPFGCQCLPQWLCRPFPTNKIRVFSYSTNFTSLTLKFNSLHIAERRNVEGQGRFSNFNYRSFVGCCFLSEDAKESSSRWHTNSILCWLVFFHLNPFPLLSMGFVRNDEKTFFFVLILANLLMLLCSSGFCLCSEKKVLIFMFIFSN